MQPQQTAAAAAPTPGGRAPLSSIIKRWHGPPGSVPPPQQQIGPYGYCLMADIVYPVIHQALTPERAMGFLGKVQESITKLAFCWARFEKPRSGDCFFIVRPVFTLRTVSAVVNVPPLVLPDGYTWGREEWSGIPLNVGSTYMSVRWTNEVISPDTTGNQMSRLEYKIDWNSISTLQRQSASHAQVPQNPPQQQLVFIHYIETERLKEQFPAIFANYQQTLALARQKMLENSRSGTASRKRPSPSPSPNPLSGRNTPPPPTAAQQGIPRHQLINKQLAQFQKFIPDAPSPSQDGKGSEVGLLVCEALSRTIERLFIDEKVFKIENEFSIEELEKEIKICNEDIDELEKSLEVFNATNAKPSDHSNSPPTSRAYSELLDLIISK